MIPTESDGIRRNSGIPVNSCGFRRNFRIPADSGGICGGIKSIDDTSKINIVKHTGTGSAPQEAVALVVKLPDRITEWGERPALVSDIGPSECGKKFVLCFHHYSL